MCGQGLQNSTIGIVGMGRIGMATAQRLKPFGPTHILYSGNSEKPEARNTLSAEFVTLDELLAKSDFVICTCSISDQNKRMFNKYTFQKMKKSAIFVNMARGGLVDHEDLYEALVGGEIRSAGLDAMEPEPLPSDHKLLTLKNCVITPHIGSSTEETRNAMSALNARNIITALNGEKMPAPLT